MPFTIIRNDITKLDVDVIVNAANTNLLMGGGVCGAIFRAAGIKELQLACSKYSPIKTGEAIITLGFKLNAKYVIHTAGPIYQNGKQNEEELLRSCYINSLELATKYDCTSIAFPLISSGIYGYPKADALRVATDAILNFLIDNEMEVFLVVYDANSFEVSKDIQSEVECFIDEHYIKEKEFSRLDFSHMSRKALQSVDEEVSFSLLPLQKDEKEISLKLYDVNVDDLMENLDVPFSVMLLRLIDESGRKDSEIYHRANIDRRLFSKIRSNDNYTPRKTTVVAFAIALELTLEQTKDLLQRAGFALSHSSIFDVIIEYFITNKKYNVFSINEILFKYDQPLLGG